MKIKKQIAQPFMLSAILLISMINGYAMKEEKKQSFLEAAEPALTPEEQQMQNRALFQCVKEGDFFGVNLALQDGANINSLDRYGYTVLMLAAQKGDTRMVQLLLNNNANVHAKGIFNRSALHMAVDLRYTPEIEEQAKRIIELLLQAGSHINQQDGQGYTPLMIVAYHGNLCTAQFLVGRGARLILSPYIQRTALSIARERMYHQLVQFFEQQAESPLLQMWRQIYPRDIVEKIGGILISALIFYTFYNVFISNMGHKS